ncbi:MAG: 1-deoxy-D-xylulose-5-phosphate synthase N-terminal domain-containing protein [Candidatus Omnitrophota bacterium]
MGKVINKLQEVYDVAFGIRRRVLEYTLKNNGGYLSQACSSAEIFAALYTRIMNLGTVKEPIVPGKFCGVPGKNISAYQQGSFYNGQHLPEYDRFFLSPTHYSLVLYATLVETGRMHEAGLDEFNKDGSIVEMIGAEHSPGMEVMTGSLGQGISQAAGVAMARRLKKEKGKVWIFMSDGELQSGQVWEAVQTMCFYKLDNIGIYVDVNGFQCDGETSVVMNIEPLDEKFAVFGCKVVRVNGHDIKKLVKAAAVKRKNRPLVVICDTKPWQGIDRLKKRSPRFHYIRFTGENEHKEFANILSSMKINLSLRKRKERFMHGYA